VRAFLMALVLVGAGTSALAEPSPMYVRAVPERVETPAPREQPPIVLKLAMHEPEEKPLPAPATRTERPSLMEQVRDHLCEQLPAVSNAIVTPLPIASADGTLAGVGVLGHF
jgi:hypothetical protein